MPDNVPRKADPSLRSGAGPPLLQIDLQNLNRIRRQHVLHAPALDGYRRLTGTMRLGFAMVLVAHVVFAFNVSI